MEKVPDGLDPTQVEALSLLASTADRLENAVSEMSESELDRSSGPGAWTVRQIVHHLVDGSILWTAFFSQAIAGFGTNVHMAGRFPGNEAWAEALDFDKRPVQNAVALVVAHHRFMAEAAAFFPDRWERYVAFPSPDGDRKVTAGQIVKMLGEHLAEHLATIEGIGGGRKRVPFSTDQEE